MRKLTKAQAIELLKAAGAQVADIVDTDEAADKDFSVDSELAHIDTARRAIIKPQIEATIREEVKTEVAGKSAGKIRTSLARVFGSTGVTAKDLEGKTDDEMFEFVREKVSALAGTDSKTLREKLDKMAEEHAEAIDKLKKDNETALATSEAKFIERDIDAVLTEMVSKIPRTGGEAGRQAEALKVHLRSLYDIKYDPTTKEIEFREKGKETPVYNKENTRRLAVNDVASPYFENLGILAKDTRNQNGRDAMNNFQSGSGNGGNGGGNGGGNNEGLSSATAGLGNKIDSLIDG